MIRIYFKYIIYSALTLITLSLQSQSAKDSIEVKAVKLPENINTYFSEFNPTISYDGYLYYSSYYPVNIDTLNNIFNSTFITEVFKIKMSSQGYGEKELLGKGINDKRNHNANITFNKNMNVIYFARCTDIDGTVGQCAIFKSEKNNFGKWSKAKKLPDHINKKFSSNTQPYLFESRNYTVLYYVSDRDDGYGGTDIWYTIINDDEYSIPTNLGSNINTENNEMTPFYYPYNNSLYFSSDGHQGMGGMDIFESEGSLNSWSEVKKLPYPINSQEDDMYFVINYSGEAFFSSNRKEASHPPGKEFCCSDIFYVKYLITENEIEKDTSEIIDTISVVNYNKIKDLLPISLYFDNDIPDPGSKKATTDKNYKNLISDYILQQEKYKTEYSKNLNAKDSIDAVNEITNFFVENVENSFIKLDTLAKLLIAELDKGIILNIKIKGYASPINSSDYNEILSRRRIVSLINFLSEYENGIFKKYLDGSAENGGKLNIFQEPYGDSKASEFVSDNPNDKRNSVYSKAAALERKVEIMYFSVGSEENTEYAVLNTPDSINIGEFNKNKTKINLLILENKGKSDLIIDSIFSNCACVKISKNKIKLESNEKSSIKIEILQTKLIDNLEIIIHSNSNNSPHIIKLFFSK